MLSRILMCCVLLCVLCVGCGPNVTATSDIKQAQQTEKAMSEANSQIGMPAITNFQERKLAKLIFELRDREDLVCYAYLYNRDAGQIGQFLGKCIGFGLPYSVQFTNPEKVIDGADHLGYNAHYNVMKIPQPDPNGLFMPSGLSATWLMLLDSKGQPHPVYIEPEIIVSPFPLHQL